MTTSIRLKFHYPSIPPTCVACGEKTSQDDKTAFERRIKRRVILDSSSKVLYSHQRVSAYGKVMGTDSRTETTYHYRLEDFTIRLPYCEQCGALARRIAIRDGLLSIFSTIWAVICITAGLVVSFTPSIMDKLKINGIVAIILFIIILLAPIWFIFGYLMPRIMVQGWKAPGVKDKLEMWNRLEHAVNIKIKDKQVGKKDYDAGELVEDKILYEFGNEEFAREFIEYNKNIMLWNSLPKEDQVNEAREPA